MYEWANWNSPIREKNRRKDSIYVIMNNFNYYDIESLENVFTVANFREKENDIEIYYLLDNPEILSDPDWQSRMSERIYEKNKNFNGTIHYYDLLKDEGCMRLVMTFGACTATSGERRYDFERFRKIKKELDEAKANSKDQNAIARLSRKVEIERTYCKKLQGDWSTKLRLIADTDPEYDPEIHPYLLGYNSYNYDTTMLAIYICSVVQSSDKEEDRDKLTTYIRPTHPLTGKPTITAKQLRKHNDIIFKKHKKQMPQYLADLSDDKYKGKYWRVRANMLMSGRHLDVARLNEKQAKVGLKRLLGMLGFQILESEKLKNDTRINTADEFYDLIAYNVSDVVNLKELFYHKAYMSQFELKKGMLESYPELIYQQTLEKEINENGISVRKYKPDTNPATRRIKPDRLRIDSSSGQFATQCLCPYGHLDDIPFVSYMYPSENKARELGIPRVNVLEEAKTFFYKLYPQPEVRAQFDVIYDFYKSIEGKNFNDSKNYQEKYAHPCYSMSEIPKVNTCMPYFDGEGNPTSCFVQFSIGGIHGAEYNKLRYDNHMAAWQKTADDMAEAKRQFPNPVDLRKAKKITMPDGRELAYTVFLKSGKKIVDSEYKDIEKRKPQLFKMSKKETTKLNDKYTYTSAEQSNHQDFVSYYPGLLMAMEAFMNTGLGYDRYEEIFGLKQKYGKLMKDESLPKEEIARYKILREGTKLVLNSASGTADAVFENNIRVNNQIISMRIIGQLLTWHIGQAEAYHGAKIISTNTDGLYSVMEATINNKILEKESKDIGVEIEPEPLYLISKDTNNRIEMTDSHGKVLSTSGGTLGCSDGPNPTKALSHPAIIDWALTKYLIKAANREEETGLDKPFNKTVGLDILESARDEFDDFKYLQMYQNILAPSSSGTVSYIYGMDTPDDVNSWIILQKFNRIFMMKPDTPDTIHLQAAGARKITPAMKQTRSKDKSLPEIIMEPVATQVVKENGGEHDIPEGHDIVSKKITNLDPKIPVFIQNKDLHLLEQSEKDFIIDNLDIDCYLWLLQHTFEESWMNKAS